MGELADALGSSPGGLERTIRNWLACDLWGERGHDATAVTLSIQTDDQLILVMFEAGVARLFPHAGRTEVQMILDAVRQEYRVRAIVGPVEMERRLRA